MSRRISPGEERHVNEFVVFKEAHEHAGQNPRAGDLRQFFVAPGIVGEAGVALPPTLREQP